MSERDKIDLLLKARWHYDPLSAIAQCTKGSLPGLVPLKTTIIRSQFLPIFIFIFVKWFDQNFYFYFCVRLWFNTFAKTYLFFPKIMHKGLHVCNFVIDNNCYEFLFRGPTYGSYLAHIFVQHQFVSLQSSSDTVWAYPMAKGTTDKNTLNLWVFWKIIRRVFWK